MNKNNEVNKMKNDIMERMQVRTAYDSEFSIHIQIKGSINLNREYGYATELRTGKDVISWLSKQEPTNTSAASSGVYYIPMEAVQFEDNTHGLLIQGEEYNHKEGCIIGVNPTSPQITQMFDYVIQADAFRSVNLSEVLVTYQAVTLVEGDDEDVE